MMRTSWIPRVVPYGRQMRVETSPDGERAPSLTESVKLAAMTGRRFEP